jgi:hypothetical protein
LEGPTNGHLRPLAGHSQPRDFGVLSAQQRHDHVDDTRHGVHADAGAGELGVQPLGDGVGPTPWHGPHAAPKHVQDLARILRGNDAD